MVAFAEAGICTGVADRTGRDGLNQERVLVAILQDIDNLEEITTRLALGPELLPGAAIESNLAGLYRFLIGFFVHEAQHQDFARVVVLYDGGNKAAHFLKIQFHIHV